jgi:uncharacterized protein YbjT (DUF2867 family)
MSKILVTGPTGNVGGEVFTRLMAKGAPAVAAAHNVDKARQQLGVDAAIVHFDFTKPETFKVAFDGVEKMFLVRPPAIADVKQDIAPALVAAKHAGVKHAVFLSLLGVERNPVVPHRAIEKAVRESGMAWTFLRAGFFMQNLSTTHCDDIRERGDVFVPAGKGRTSFIDVRDIAEVVVKVLTEPGHENKAYSLTGAVALTYGDVAREMTEVLGKPVRYSNPSPRNFGKEMRRRGTPLPFILVMNALYTVCRVGGAAQVTPDAERLLDRKPIAMRQFIEDYRSVWM